MKGSGVMVALLAACAANVASFPTSNGVAVAAPVQGQELWARKHKNETSTATKKGKGKGKGKDKGKGKGKGSKKNATAANTAAQGTGAAAAAGTTNDPNNLLAEIEAALGGSGSDLLTSLSSLLGARDGVEKRHHQGKTTKKAGAEKNSTKAAKAAKAHARSVDLISDDELEARSEEVEELTARDIEEAAELFARHHQGKKTSKTAGKNKTRAHKADARDVEVEELVSRDVEEAAELFARHHQGKKTSKTAGKNKTKTHKATAHDAEVEQLVARDVEGAAELFARHHQGKKTSKTAGKNKTKAANSRHDE